MWFDDAVVWTDAWTPQTSFDLATGAQRWSYQLPLIDTGGNSVGAATQAGENVVITSKGFLNENPGGLQVIDRNGQPRFVVNELPLASPGDVLTAPFVSDGAGHLFAAEQTVTGPKVITITAADSQLNAPATVCSRVDCGAGMVDLTSDPENCGACGVQCSDWKLTTCSFGACR